MSELPYVARRTCQKNVASGRGSGKIERYSTIFLHGIIKENTIIEVQASPRWQLTRVLFTEGTSAYTRTSDWWVAGHTAIM